MLVVDFLNSKAEHKGQSLIYRTPMENYPAIIADPLAIESIFGNLITNAIKYTQKDGCIEIEVIWNEKNVVVSVKDNGFGIGYSASVSSKEEETYTSGYYYNYYTTTTRTISTSEIELLYNLNIGNGFSVTPSYITGSITQDDDGILSYESDLSGFGIYLNFPSIVKSGQGLSIFAKQLSTEKSKIALAGLQFAW